MVSVAPDSWHYDWDVTLHNTKRQDAELQIGSTQKQKQYWFPNPVVFASSSHYEVLKFMCHHLEDAKINQGQVNSKRGII